MDQPPFLPLIGAFIAALGVLPYLRMIATGQVKPNPVTWLVWSFQGALMCWALWRGGARGGMLLAGAFLFCRVITLLAALRKRRDGLGGFGKPALFPEGICLIGALSAGFWLLVSDDYAFALLLLLTIDALGLVPTVVRVFQQPEREHVLPWSISMLGSAITVAGVVGKPLVDMVFPLWGFVNGSAILAAKFLGSQRR